MLGVLIRITPEAAVVDHKVDGVRTRIPRAAWMLGAMALAFGLSEGTAVDWSSLHVTDVARVDPTTGALGLVAVSGFMVVIRLLGDRLVARFGRRAVVRFGGTCAALGYLTVTLVSNLPLLIAGWALVGFGVGMIAPQVYAVAGHMGGGRVLAVVVTFGYAAFLIGPAVVGFLVDQLGIHHAMAVPAVLCAGIIALAATMPRTDDLTSARRHADHDPGITDRVRGRSRGEQDEVDGSSTPGGGSGPTSTSRRWRCCRGSAGSPGISIGNGQRVQPHGLEYWEFDVLAALRRAGSPYQLSARSTAEGDPGHLGHHDQPGRPAGRPRTGGPRGASRRSPRRPGPADRGGQTAVDAALADLLEAERTLLLPLDPADQTQLAGQLRALLLPYRDSVQ